MLLAAAISGAALVASSAQAGVRWGPRQRLGSVGYYPTSYQLAGNARGDEAIVWEEPDGALKVARAHPGGTFGPGRLLSRRAYEEPAVAMNRRGDLIIAWDYSDNSYVPPPDSREGSRCCDHVRVAMLDRTGRIRARETLTPDGVTSDVAAVALADDGSTAAVLYRSSLPSRASGLSESGVSHILLRVARFGKSFGRVVGFGYDGPESLRADSRGVTVVYGTEAGTEANPFEWFEREPELSVATMIEARVPANGRRVTRRRLARIRYEAGGISNEGVVDMQFNYDAHGDLAALFTLRLDSVGLRLATLRPGASLHARNVRSASKSPPLDRTFSAPAMAVAPSGRGIVTWSGYEHDQIGVALGKLPSDVFRLRAVLHPLPANRTLEAMSDAIDSDGQAAIALTASGTFGEGRSVVAVLRSAGGHFEKAKLLAGYGLREGEAAPRVVIDSHGSGVVTWVGPSRSVFAQRFQAP